MKKRGTILNRILEAFLFFAASTIFAICFFGGILLFTDEGDAKLGNRRSSSSDNKDPDKNKNKNDGNKDGKTDDQKDDQDDQKDDQKDDRKDDQKDDPDEGNAVPSGDGVPGLNEGAGLTKDNPAKTRKEFADAVFKKSLTETEDDVVVYTTGISDMDVQSLNYYLDKTYAKSKSYYLDDVTGSDVQKVTLTMKKTESYYVYHKLINGRDIPAEETMAAEEAEVVEKVLRERISPEMSEYEKELALHDYLIENCSYGTDNVDKTEYHTAYGALVGQVAVCEGYAYALELLLNCSGIECRLISGMAADSSESHAWNQVKIDGEWYHVDSTWDDPTGDGQDSDDGDTNERHTFFNLPDEYIHELNHNWDTSEFIVCTSDEKNYYKVNGMMYASYDELKAAVKEKAGPGTVFEAAILNYDSSVYDIPALVRDAGFTSAFSWSFGSKMEKCIYQGLRIVFP